MLLDISRFYFILLYLLIVRGVRTIILALIVSIGWRMNLLVNADSDPAKKDAFIVCFAFVSDMFKIIF